MYKRTELVCIIAGGRDFNNYSLLEDYCYKILTPYIEKGVRIIIRSGHAKGADILEEKFAKENNFDLEIYEADWFLYGKQAGFIRNAQMAHGKDGDKAADILIAFWDNESKGTNHMIKIMYEQVFTSVFVCNY